MNQKGEVSLMGILVLVVLTGIVMLGALELEHSYRKLQHRTQLFLCTKEAKEELALYLRFMGKTNWAIKNTHRAGMIMIFIPGLQGASMNAEKIKRIIIKLQNLKLASYLKTLRNLTQKSCALDPRMFITPFNLGPLGYQRTSEGVALLRKNQWSYLFHEPPYALSLKIQLLTLESLKPKIQFITEERGGKLSFLSP